MERKRSEREPSSDEHSSSYSDYSSESDDTKSQPQRKKKNHAKTLQAIPTGKNMTGVINHACMVRPTGQGTKNGNPRWLMDSGASNHYTSNHQLPTNAIVIDPTPIKTANEIIHATAKGYLVLYLSCGTISIADVMYSTDLLPNTHLISIGQLEAKGLEFTLKNGKRFIFKQGTLWAVANRGDFVYCLEECSPNAMALQTLWFPRLVPPPSWCTDNPE